jgi:hypothetical protein
MAKLTNKEYISALQTERFELREHVLSLTDRIRDLEAYLASAKFAGTDSDYVHVSTDILPKIRKLRNDAELVTFIAIARKESV